MRERNEDNMISRTVIYTVVSIAAPLALALSVAGPVRADASAGESLAEHWCSQCHAVKRNQASPNPKAPSFPVAAAQPSITEYTLRVFLRTEHVQMPNFI